MTQLVVPAAATKVSRSQDPIKVMIVDDSAVVRGLLARWLDADSEITVVRSVGDGTQAVKYAATSGAEVIILDIDMPVMDGIQALPKIIKAQPGVKVIMSSTLTRRNAEISLRALELGAADYMAKPDTVRGLTTAEEFSHELILKVKALAGSSRCVARTIVPPASKSNDDSAPIIVREAPPSQLRAMPLLMPQVIAIGSSTGGPQALMRFCEKLGAKVSVPIFITQHMPPTFTAILAEHLARVSGLPAAEAKDGEVVEGGRIYVAPGGMHLEVVREGKTIRVHLSEGVTEHYCRPAVDPMFRSLAKAYGGSILALIFTGMGRDGCDGARAITEVGGAVFAQDLESSVVWGMPGAIAQAGLASIIAPVDELAEKTFGLIRGGLR